MDISNYLRLFRRWYWLILVMGVVGGIFGFIFALLSEPSYVANTLISVGGYIQSPDPQAAEVSAGVNLAQTYLAMATTRDVLQAAVDETGFPLTVEELRDNDIVTATVMPETSILKLSVKYTNPALAASLANQIAQQLILISPTDPRLSRSGRREVPSNYLEVVEWAAVPNKPSGAGPLQFTVLGGFLGGVLAGGTILLLNYLDHSIRTTEEIDEATIGTVLATIPRYKKLSDKQHLVKFGAPNTPIADRFRSLRTLLLYDAEDEEHLLYVVTSPNPNEGKSFVTANLALAFAASEKRVLFIDADLHRPMAHEMFGQTNDKGIIDLLNTEPPDRSDDQSAKAYAELAKYCKGTDYERLCVMTSGTPSPNPTELLGSRRAAKWFSILKALPDFDVILIDSPPSLVATDSFVIAAATGGSIIMVVRSGKTEKTAAEELRISAERLDLTFRGVILNDVPPQELGGYYRKSLEYYRVGTPRKRFQGIKFKSRSQDMPE